VLTAAAAEKNNDILMRTRQRRSPQDPCSRRPSDNGLLAPWAATGRRKAAVGLHW
jgi:hypothetical protein